MRLFILQLIVGIGMSGCASTLMEQNSVVEETGVVHESVSAGSVADRKIHVNDVVILHVVPGKEFEEDLELTVNMEGEILVPLGGWIKIEDKTTSEAGEAIKNVLDKFIVDPEVSVRIKEASSRAVVILGQVRKPGTYEFPQSGKMTFLEVVAKAEGFTDIANLPKVKIVRNAPNKTQKTIHVNAEKLMEGEGADIELQEGDLITVPETLF